MKLKTVFAVLALGLTAAAASAADATCHQRSEEKKLAGAARNSFLTKCEKDAVAACTNKAADKKLSGAAKTSFTNKCVRDAVGVEAPKPAS